MMKTFKKPDLNAPRCREDGYKIIGRKFLNEFVEKYPQYKDLSLEDVKNILKTFHGKLWDHALNNRDGVELPEGLGFIFVGTCQAAKTFVIDFASSIEYDEKIRHRNFASDNYLAKIFYTNFANKYKFKNREMWMFKGTRDFKRAVAKVYPEKWKMYVQVESGRSISKYMQRYRKNAYLEKKERDFEIDPLYNEFDID